MGANPVRERFVGLAESLLPAEELVVERNATITATYARWYLSDPSHLKWAGMAAFASKQVGKALSGFEFISSAGNLIARNVFSRLEKPISAIPTIELLRQTNNSVFRDIGWTHLAYLARDGGFRAIEQGLQDLLPDGQYLLDGFRMIDSVRAPAAAQAIAAPGQSQIWDGNELLLKNEQWLTVQSHFKTLDSDASKLLSIATVMDFDADEFQFDINTRTSFESHLLTKGLPLLVQTKSAPDISRLDHRWFWVSGAVLPIWKNLDQNDSLLTKKLQHLVQLGRGSG